MTTKLGDELVFLRDGHLHDVALTAIADGQDAIVPETALAHLELCPDCTRRLSDQAWLSASLGAVLAPSGRNALAFDAPVNMGFPVLWVLVATALAALGLFVDGSALGSSLGALPALVFHGSPIAIRTVERAFATQAGQMLSLCLSIGTTVVLVFAGAFVARMPPKSPVVSRSGRGVES